MPRLVHVAGMNQAEHRAENLGVGQFAGGGTHHRESSASRSCPLRVWGSSRLRPSSRTFAPCFSPTAIRDSIRDLLCARNNWPHLHAFVETVAHSQGRRRFGDGIAESLLRFADGDGHGDRQAALARAAERAVADDLRRHLHIGIRQNDDVILRAALALRALAVGAARA